MSRAARVMVAALILAWMGASAGGAGESDVARCIRESGRAEKFVETVYVDRSAMPAPLPEEDDRGYLVFRRHWMDLVFPNSVPARQEVTQTLKVFASPAEYEPVSFCLRTLRELRNVRVAATELVSEEGKRLPAPEVRTVRLVPKMWQDTRPLCPDGPIGIMNMPAYLEACPSVDVEEGTTIQYWVTIEVPEDATAGVYEGAIEIAVEGREAYQLHLMTRVLPITLVEPETRMGFWDYYAEEYQEEMGPLEEVYLAMRRHGVNSLICRGNRLLKKEHLSLDERGNVQLDMEGSNLEEALDLCKRLGFRSVFLWHQTEYFQWALDTTKKRLDKETLKRQVASGVADMKRRFQGDRNYSTIAQEIDKASDYWPGMFSEEFGRIFGQVIHALFEEWHRRGWPQLCLTTCDETPSHHAHDRITWLYTIRCLEIMKRAGADTILQMTLPSTRSEHAAYSRAAAPFVDIAMPVPLFAPESNWYYRGVFSDHLKALREAGKTVYVYNHHQAKVPDPTTTRFIASYFVHTIAEGVKGMFTYVFYRNAGDPYNPIDGRYWASEQFWIYPPDPEQGRLGGHSISLEALREGWDDYRYLETLTELIQRVRENTTSREAREATQAAASLQRRILASMDVTEVLKEVQPRGIWDVTSARPGEQSFVEGKLRLRNGWSFEDYDDARWKMAQEILKLQQMSGKDTGMSSQR